MTRLADPLAALAPSNGLTPSPEPALSPEEPSLTDIGNALRVAAEHAGTIRYVKPWRRWLIWDGRRYAPDETGGITRLGVQTIRGWYRAAAEAGSRQERARLAEHARRSEAEPRVRAMIALAAEVGPGIPVTPAELDADPMVMTVNNCTVDLRTGSPRPHRPADLITKLAPVTYDPNAECPRWTAFLDRIFEGNTRLIRYVQRVVGHALTGDTREQDLFMPYGKGANGKTTFLVTLQEMLGDYAEQAPASMLLTKDVAAIPNDVARLQGTRFVVAAESAEGRRLDEALVKQLTGRDRVTARFMRAEFFTFTPTFKMFLCTNHRPIIRGTDYAIWRRIKLIPFTVTIPEAEQDPLLLDKLRTERAGIFAWAVAGCLEWQRIGLSTPSEVQTATAGYRAEMDVLGDFLRDRCVLEPEASITGKELFDAYTAWCSESNERPMTRKEFTSRLTERGPTLKRTGVARGWVGIRLRGVTDPVTDDAS
jgi:putative DNA primase/helicase